jgi:Ca2+-binding EF-hand superfamily protein
MLVLSRTASFVQKTKKVTPTTKTVARVRRLLGERFQTVGDAFSSLDQNGDGKISRREFKRVLLDLTGGRVTDEEAEVVLREMDFDDSGYLDFREFCVLYATAAKRASVGMYELTTLLFDAMKSSYDSLPDVFRKFDKDRSGTLTLDEFVLMVSSFSRKISRVKVEALFNEIDIDSSGHLHYDEFLRYFKKHMSTSPPPSCLSHPHSLPPHPPVAPREVLPRPARRVHEPRLTFPPLRPKQRRPHQPRRVQGGHVRVVQGFLAGRGGGADPKLGPRRLGLR